MSVSRFTLPDVGEGLTEAEIVEWKVAPGDTISINQVLVEIETAKSLVELPSPYVGVVGEILVEPGTTVDVGTVIITILSEAGATDADAAVPAPDAATPADDDLTAAAQDAGGTISQEPAEESPAVLVGRGAAASMPTRRRRHVVPPIAHEALAAAPTAPPQGGPAASGPRSATAATGPARATPP
ncbi:2-oxo acid dehydrogenase subunit E2, partial [Cryobacterium adonitolivorans]